MEANYHNTGNFNNFVWNSIRIFQTIPVLAKWPFQWSY